jgi:hypothetical protein
MEQAVCNRPRKKKLFAIDRVLAISIRTDWQTNSWVAASWAILQSIHQPAERCDRGKRANTQQSPALHLDIACLHFLPSGQPPRYWARIPSPNVLTCQTTRILIFGPQFYRMSNTQVQCKHPNELLSFQHKAGWFWNIHLEVHSASTKKIMLS